MRPAATQLDHVSPFMKNFRQSAERRELDSAHRTVIDRAAETAIALPDVTLAHDGAVPRLDGEKPGGVLAAETSGGPDLTVKRTQIFLVDPHLVVLRGLTAMIDAEVEFAVCGQASSPDTALRNIAERPVSLIITGLNFPGCQGVDIVTRLKAAFPRIPVLVFTFCTELAKAAMQAGAQGCVDKAEDWETLRAAIRCVVSGGVYLSHAAVRGLTAASSPPAGNTAHSPERVLSRQELLIFEKVGDGFMPSEIAANLRVSVRTVESYCGRIREKLDLESSADLRRRAVSWMRNRIETPHGSNP